VTFNPPTLNRQTLYELVWSKPLVEIAKQFNMSDVGLAKRCRAVDVPVPYRGYWARKDAGQEPPKTPLPKYRNESTRADSKGKGSSVPRALVKEGAEPVVAFAPLPAKAERKTTPSTPAANATYAKIEAIAVLGWKTPETMHAAVKRSAITLAAYRVKDFSWAKKDRDGTQIEIEVSEEAKVRIPAHGGQDFQVNVDIDFSATWTGLRCDRGQFRGEPKSRSRCRAGMVNMLTVMLPLTQSYTYSVQPAR
jgi:hypothetical protein